MSTGDLGGTDDASIQSAFTRAKVDAQEWATVYVGNPTTLLLDLDGPGALEQFEKAYDVVARNFNIAEVDRWLSKSGNLHVVLHSTTPLTPAIRLLLQAALGSDGVREALGLLRYQHGVAEPSMLFRPRKRAVEASSGSASTLEMELG